MVVVNVNCGISGESNEGASGGLVDGLESKTLAENPSDKGFLSEGIRVSEDSNVLDGESNTNDLTSGSGKEYVESDRSKINDRLDVSKNHMSSRSNRWDSWESWGVMNMVGRVLGGKFSMDDDDDDDDDVEDVNTSKIVRETSVVEMENLNTSKFGQEGSVVEMEDLNTLKIGQEGSVVEMEDLNASKIGQEGSVVEMDDLNTSEIGQEGSVVEMDDLNTSEIGQEGSVVEMEDLTTKIGQEGSMAEMEDLNTFEIGQEGSVVEIKDLNTSKIGQKGISIENSNTSKIGQEGIEIENSNTSKIGQEGIVVEIEVLNTSKIGSEASVVEVENSHTSKIGLVASVEMERLTTYKTGREGNAVDLESVSTFKNGCKSNVDADTNTWQGVTGELISVDNTEVERIATEKDSNELSSDYLIEETSLKVDKDSDELISDYSVAGTRLNVDKVPDALISDYLAEGTSLMEDKDSDKLVEGTGLNGDKDSDKLILDYLAEGTRLYVDKDSDELISDYLTEGTSLTDATDSDKLVEETGLIWGKDSDKLISDYLAERTGLTEEKDLGELVEGTGLNGDKDLDALTLDYVAEGTGSTGEEDLFSNELVPEGSGLNGDHQEPLPNQLVPDGTLETEKVDDVEVEAFLMPKTRGEHQMAEEEGEYYVSDLVWGKVKGHPWWPGQIFPPIAASDKATKHIRKQSYLIAFFGDQTFAWNERWQLKHFRMHFSRMEKQSNSDRFCHAVSCALDEVTRRVEFGLSCPCLSEEVRDKIKMQVVSNAGIREDKNVVYGGDNLSSVASFVPGNLVEFLESVAEFRQSKTDRFQFTMAKSQLLAFNRWKGHYKLPVLEEYFGLLGDDTQVAVEGKGEDSLGDDFSSRKRKSTAQDGSSQKCKHPSGEKDFPIIKEKRMSALMSSSSSTLPNGDEKPMKKARRRSISSGQNSEGTNSLASNSNTKRRKRPLPTSPIGNAEKSREAKLRFCEESELVEIILSDMPTPDVILSKLILAAKVPVQGFNIMIPEIDFLREFRNLVCLEKKSSCRNAEMDAGKCKGKQSSNSETANTFGLEGIEDSYWTDRIIQTYSQDQELFEPKNPSDEALEVEEEADIKKKDDVATNLGSEKPSEEYQPTALILNFRNLDSIPSVTNLNQICNIFGPLNESETEILCKSKRAKVIFKRRADAETAFSSMGKYSTFGPSLISYKLHYAPTLRKSRGASKRSKKDTSLKVYT